MFRFRFESLLQIARSQQTAARAELAESIQTLAGIEQQRQQITLRRRELIAENDAPRLGPMRVDQLAALARYERQLDREDAQLAAAAEQCEAQIACRRDAVQAADIELQRFERLKQRDRDAWSRGQAKREQRELDEFAARSQRLAESG